MKLNEEQEQRVADFVANEGVKLDSLRNDLIDHLCCVIETRLHKDIPFEELLENAAKELAPNGLGDVERETIYLLNSNKIIMMKKAMYSIGFIGSLALTGGVTFKLLHWPGANAMLMTGFVALFLIFVPLLAIDRYKVALAGLMSEKLKLIFGVASSLIVGLSVLFKFFHLQGASVLLILGALLFAFGFLPFLFFTLYKRSVG